MSIESRELSGKEKRLNNCYQQLIRRISSDVVYILKWLEYYATIRGENQDTERRTMMFLGSLHRDLSRKGGILCPKLMAPGVGAETFFTLIW